MIKTYPKVGDMVRTRPGSVAHKVFGNVEGYVVKVDFWGGQENLTPENHGSLEIKLTNVGTLDYLEVGDTELFSLYGWDDSFEIV